MRLTLVVSLALTLTPIASFAYSDKTPVEAYQETIQKLNVEYEKLKRLTADAKQKVAELEKDANRIKALIDKYEAALGTTTLEKTAKLTDAVSVSSDGNVGIGTKNPQALLHLLDVKTGRRLLFEERNDVGAFQFRNPYDGFSFSSGHSKNDQASMHISQFGGVSIGFDDWTSHAIGQKNATRFVVNGNVGIGTTSPGTKLDVNGNAFFGNLLVGHPLKHSSDWTGIKNKNSTQYALIQNATGTHTFMNKKSGGGYLGFRVDNVDKMVINNTGDVGIGTRTPQYKLDVKGQVRADNVTVKSDQRHKQNIHSLKNALTKLQELRGVSFKWKDNAQNADPQIGLIAQEVEKVLPELVSTDSEGYKSIAYGKLTAVLVEALKELQQQNETMAKKIEALSTSQP